MSGKVSAEQLENSLLLASASDPSALRRFYETLFLAEFFVPERFQGVALSDTPSYPDQFFNLLGLRAESHTVVPLFSRPELIEQWCGNKLSYRALSLKSIVELVPAEWWLCVNPGMEVEKEFSPWEIEKLRSGPESIAEIIDDLVLEDTPLEFEIGALAADQEPRLLQFLLEELPRRSIIERAHLIVERSSSAEGEKMERYVLALFCSTHDDAALRATRREIKHLCDTLLIGSWPLRVIASEVENPDPISAMCSKIPPFYTKRSQ